MEAQVRKVEIQGEVSHRSGAKSISCSQQDLGKRIGSSLAGCSDIGQTPKRFWVNGLRLSVKSLSLSPPGLKYPGIHSLGLSHLPPLLH